MPLKMHYIDFREQTGNKVTPDEIDRYEQYQVINPSVSATLFGGTAGTANKTVAIGLSNVVADYPRNLAAHFSGSAAVSGTVTVKGKNQFGEETVEELGLTQGTQTSGIIAGNKIFALVTEASVNFGSGVVGTGTVSLGVPTTGTVAYFGLPAKIKDENDVKAITWTDSTGGAKPLNGGTIGAFVDAEVHAFRGTANLAGTMTYSVLFKPTYYKDSMALMANL